MCLRVSILNIMAYMNKTNIVSITRFYLNYGNN